MQTILLVLRLIAIGLYIHTYIHLFESGSWSIEK